MHSYSKKLILGIIIMVMIASTLMMPAYATYENDQYIKVTRTLVPDSTAPELGSTQDIKYSISGDEFTLDPSVVNPQTLAEKDIALVLDISGSMSSTLSGTQTRMAVLKESAVKFINKFAGTNTKICIVPFGYTANSTTELLSMQSASNVTYLINTVNGLAANEDTNTGDGMRRSYWKLKNAPVYPSGNSKYMILMTDGDANEYTTAVSGSASAYKLDDGNALYHYSDSTKPALYAKIIGSMLASEKITTLFVGLTQTTSSVLEGIAVSSGASPVPTGLHYYKVTTAADIDSLYVNFADSIASTFTIPVSFSDVIPQGVEVIKLPQGFTSQLQADGTSLVTGTIPNISLVKNNATGKYGITPWEGVIKVKYNTKGIKVFDKLQISYVDPFSNNKTAVVQNNVSLNVVDTTPPSVPQGLTLLQNLGTNVEIGWNGSADLSGISAYEVYRDGILVGTTVSTSYKDAGLTQNKNYSYTVKAVDNSDLRSIESAPLQVLTKDIDAPSIPTNLKTAVISPDSAAITWDVSTDNVGVAGYKIYADGNFVTTVQDTRYTATGLAPGVHYQYAVSAVDAAGNESLKAPITVTANTPPVAKAGPDQTVEGVDSNGAPVTLDASASYDPENSPLTYTWSGSFGTIIGKTVNVELPLGTSTVTLKVSDGQLESSDDVIINVVDTTAPVITGAPTIPANQYGWNNSDVPVHFTAEDKVSGIKSVSPDFLFTEEGANQETTGVAVDNAGNTASVTVSNINIDKTKPTITGAPTASPNANGWYKENVTVKFTANDNLSGILTATPDTTVSGEGANQALTGTAVDKAGNTENVTVSGINIDKTAPVITINSFNNATYLTTDSVALNYNVIDALSGIDTETADLNGVKLIKGQIISLSSLAGLNTLTVQVSDKAGNISVKSIKFNVLIASEVNISPKTLNLKSKGGENSVTATIEFFNGYNVADIDMGSVKFIVNGVEIAAQLEPTSIGDADGDGIPDRMVKLDRQKLIAALGNITGNVTITVKGNLKDGRAFAGKAVINVK